MTSTRYSISAASRITGKSRATIARHIKASKLSYELDEDGAKQIEASELMRVYGDLCDFRREEQRERHGGGFETIRAEPQPSGEGTEVEAVRAKLIEQYQAQVEHLQQALEKAQDGQNRITLLLEQRSSERNDWQHSLDAMAKTIANQTETQIRELRDGHDRKIKQLKRALHQEQSKSFWQRLTGR